VREVREAGMSEIAIAMSPVAVTREVAAKALGMGLTMFSERVQPELKVVRAGAKVLIPVAELQRWVDRHQERVL
jgi:hypothetical protein